MEILPVVTPRLKLRRFTIDDLTAFQACRRDRVLAQKHKRQPVSELLPGMQLNLRSGYIAMQAIGVLT